MNTVTLPAGMVLYHGTNVPKRWAVPLSPFWVSDREHVAEHFAVSSFGGPSCQRARVYIFELSRDVEFLSWADLYELGQWYEERGCGEAEDVERMGVEELAEFVCASRLDGWMVPNNYGDGADIMLCDAELVLELKRVKMVR